MKQRIEWSCAGHKWIEIDSDGEGNGELTSNLSANCPYCELSSCYGDCEPAQYHMMDPDTQATQTPPEGFPDPLDNAEEREARKRYNGIIDGMEALLLALACRGVDVSGFTDAISYVVEEYNITGMLNG